MRYLSMLALVGVFAVSIGRVSAGDEESAATRLVALEAEARKLLADVERLRASVPFDASSIRAELGAEYASLVGESMPEASLARVAEAVVKQLRVVMKQAVARSVAEARKLPLATTLAAPLLILQVRSGAKGGNPNWVDMLGGISGYVEERSRKELAWNPRVDMNEESRAYALGGSIPGGKAFVITKVTWRAVAKGDSNGHGEFIVRVGKRTLATGRDDSAVREGTWEGRIVVRAGEESLVQCEVANSSHVEARFEGELVDAATAGTSKD